MVSGAHPDDVDWERPVVRLMGESDGSLGLKLGRERRGGPRGRLEFLRGGAVQQTLVYKSDVDLGPLTHVDVFLRGQAEERGAAASVEGQKEPDAGFFLQSVKVKKVMENGLRSNAAVQEWNFPCFSFVRPGLIRHFFCGTFLPRKVPPTLAALWSACREETEGDHKTYRWQESPQGLQRRAAGECEEDLPVDERSSVGIEWAAPSVAEVAAEMVASWGLEHLGGDADPWKSVYGNNRDLNETALAVTCFEDASVSNGDGSATGSDAGPSTSARPGSSGGGEGTSGRGSGGRGPPTRRPQMPDVGCQEAFRWRSDGEFGRQLHAGAHPLLLQQCREVPERLADIPAHVLNAILPKGLTLEEEAVEGRVFLQDLTGLEPGVAGKRDEGFMEARKKFVCAPVCLLYQRSATKEHPSALLPLSIVLEPSQAGSPLLHPGVPERVWTLAKSYVACADAHYHFAISLYLETFVMLEPFVVAAKRELPQFHPLRRLFEPYFRGFLAESLRVREVLFGEGSAVDSLFALGRKGLEELVQGFSEAWAPSQWNLPHLQASQGLEEVNEEVPYRDDGGLVWGCITDFVKEYLLLYYPTDDEVLSDRAVQAWYREGFLAAKREAQTDQGRKAPQHGVESREFLANLVTSLIWARTGRRSAVMGGIYDYNAFVPNRPWHLTRPPMLSKENVEETTYAGYLPSKGDTAATVALCAALAVPFPKLPGTLLQDTVVDPEARPILERFQGNLSEVEIVLQGRNGMRKIPYPYLMPSTAGLGVEV